MTDDDAIRMTDDLDVVVRRSPRYGAFMVAGLILGFIVAGILVMLPVDTSQLTADYSMGASMGLLMMPWASWAWAWAGPSLSSSTGSTRRRRSGTRCGRVHRPPPGIPLGERDRTGPVSGPAGGRRSAGHGFARHHRCGRLRQCQQ